MPELCDFRRMFQVIRRRMWLWAGAAVLVIHLCAAVSLPGLQTGTGLRDRFLPEDPAVLGLLEEAQVFGSSEPLAVLIEPVELAEMAPMLREMERWCVELERLPGIFRASGPQDLAVPAWSDERGWGTQRAGELADPVRALSNHPLARTGFLRRDGRGLAILIDLEPTLASDFPARAATYRALENWRSQQSESQRMRVVGVLALEQRTASLVIRDSARLVAVLILVLGGLLSVSLGSPALAAWCVTAALLNVLSTFGLIALFGIRLSALSFAAAPIVLSVGLLDNVHIAYVFRRLRPGRAPGDAAAQARDELLVPCGWTTVTTVVALAALCASPVPQVRQFGLIGAIGASMAWATSLGLLPMLFARFRFIATPTRVEREKPTEASTRRWAGLYRSRVPLIAAIVLVVAFAPGLRRLELVAEYPRVFGDGHPITTELEEIEAQWGGVATVSFLLTPKPGHAVYDEAVIERLRDFHSLLATRDLVTGVASPFVLAAAGLRSYEQRFGSEPPEQQRRELLANLGSDPEHDESMPQWYNADTDTYRIVARVRMMQPELFSQLDSDLRGLSGGLDEFFTVRLSGWPLAYKHLEKTLLRELATSMSWVALLVAGLLLVAFRDPRLWIAAIIANAVPVVVVFGALGSWGMGFGTALLMTPGLALGLIVDDTLHAGLSLRDARAHDPVASAQALAKVRAPLAITSAILICLALGLMASELSMNRAMGAVLGPIIALAWIADTVLLPVLLRYLWPGAR
jgi:predicted RND superfamily exporter protein